MRLRTLLPLLVPVLLVSACGDEPDLFSPREEPAATGASTGDGCALGVSDLEVLAQIEALLANVAALAEDGTLNAGQTRALRNHLETARTHVGAHRYCPARAQLDAFRDQVQDFRADGHLTDRQMSPLLQPLRLLMPATPLPGEPEETYAPGVIGELRTVEVEGGEIVFEAIDGLAVFQSDLILGYADEVEASLSGAGAAAGPGELTLMSGACTILPGICDRWTDQTIGYDFLNDWGDEGTNRMMRRRILDAIAHWEARTGMRFERRSGGERLVFGNSGGCSSWLGRKDATGLEPQFINLSTVCGFGTTVHEIGHAVGLHHEHNRWDRDSNVGIERSIIIFEKLHNFSHYLILGQDVGPYDYGSIMHYGCIAHRTAGSTGNTIEPTRPGFGCADIGQRVGLSEGDVLGAYALYPPEFSITGAADGESGDRFELGLAFTTKPVRDDYIAWTSNRGGRGVLATGPDLTIRAADLPEGSQVITAWITVNSHVVARRSITLTFHNESPVVDLGPDRTVDLNRDVFVAAATTDPEDGECPLTECSYAWDPAPAQDMGGTARYRFHAEGPLTISATVTDAGGATATDAVTVTVVNSPPQPTIEVPSAGSSISAGSRLRLSGYATDANEGPGPGPGALDCSALAWSSSDPTDSFAWSTGCEPPVTFGDPGTRTLTLTATDPQGLTRSSSVTISVVDCGTNCPPDVSFRVLTAPELDGSSFTPAFTGPGYYLSTPIHLRGRINDADGPSDNPIAYEWRMRAPCLGIGGTCPEAIVLESGTVNVADPTYGGGEIFTSFTWTPQNDVTPWSGCVTTALEHTIQLWVQDVRGETNIATRRVHLACSLM